VSEGLWYFAYGSNMNRATFLERRGMHPLATRRACLAGYRLCFNIPIGPGERGVANLVPDVGARTWGVLYLLTEEEFDHLDHTELVHLGVYERLAVDVAADGDALLPAFTYRSSRTREGRKPSPRYRGLLVQGAREHALSAEYIAYLESFDLAWDERNGNQGSGSTGPSP